MQQEKTVALDTSHCVKGKLRNADHVNTAMISPQQRNRHAAGARPLIALAAIAVLSAGLTGCGMQFGSNNICTTQAVVKDGETKGDGKFTLGLPGTSLTLYPGQTATLPVTVQPVGNATGTVQIAVSGLPSGVTVQPVTAAIGSTANLTFTSNTALGAECFNGLTQVYAAYSTMALQASGTGTVTTGFGLDMVLENPDFKPATTDLPTVAIVTTDDAYITSKDDYLTGTVTIADPANKKNAYTGTMQVKGHGNTTWIMPKKPYRLKLDTKSGLLGMNSEKNWILLANYDDKTMLRDAVASQVAGMTGLPWAPQSVFVELTLNGAYQGTYQLIENVDINKNRVNIADSDTDDTTPASNGYVLEIDQREADTYHWITPHGLDIGLDDPDPPTDAEATYIHDLVNKAEASFYASNTADPTIGWRGQWDENSVVDWFITNEFMGNQDADAYSSDYFYRDAGNSLFVMGPVWDFDVSSGNVNYSAIKDPGVPWVSTQHPWYVQLFKSDPTFMAAVKTRWATIRPQMTTLPTYIDTNAATLQHAAGNNYGRWPTLYQKVWPNAQAAGTYDGEVTYLKSWLASRMTYMDKTYSN